MKTSADLTKTQKVHLTAQVLKAEEQLKTSIAEKNEVAPGVLDEIINKYQDEALKLIRGKQKDDASQSSTATTSGRGYRGRNGRWSIVSEVIEKLGPDTETKILIEEINKLSKEKGLEPLRKSSAYAMCSIARKNYREQLAREEEEAEVEEVA